MNPNSEAASIEQEIPSAVTTKLVLQLIVAHTEKDNDKFKEVSMKIARELELNNKDELAMYIYAQFGLVNTFTVTD